MLFIEYPKCTTCKKAKAYLESNNCSFEDRNIKDNNPTKEELIEWLELSKQPIRKIFNSSGLLYKELGLKDKLDLMSDEEKIELLSTNGMIVKRPILITEKGAYFGFNEEIWHKLLR